MLDPAAELRAAWAGRTTLTGQFGSAVYHRIADSGEDQTSPEGVDNPLWDVIRWMPAEPHWTGKGLEPTFVHNAFDRATAGYLTLMGADRRYLATTYTWSIISPGDVAWMAKTLEGRKVVEIGAGSGYWAWQLEQAGTDVAAYDPFPPGEDNGFAKAGPYTTVLSDDSSAVKHHQDRALLMVWPPYGGEHARHALSLYEGDLLLYAGEPWGGATADDEFYELLAAEWEQVSASPKHVSWWGINCELAAYQRKGGAS
ncbi:hypothetical protein [Streptomyces sp. NPDC093261]|uniref:hypothetical protein n=1 Tax=Streptomyces sp. NPDC093261 TaxID=3366037 RepID=UPI0038211816